MPDSTQIMAEAERAVRRGELKEALRLYGQIAHEIPVSARMVAIASLLQPDEAAVGGGLAPSSDWNSPSKATTEQTAEMLFDRGDLAGAVATYERILEARPDNELAKERLDEIRMIHANTPGVAPLISTQAKPRSTIELLERLLVQIASRRRM